MLWTYVSYKLQYNKNICTAIKSWSARRGNSNRLLYAKGESISQKGATGRS